MMMLKSFHSGFSFIRAIRINLADIFLGLKKKKGGSCASAAMGLTLFVVLAASYQL